MSGGCGTGTVIFSIDLELNLDHHEPALQRRLDDVRQQLVKLTSELEVPATWAVADPTLSAATESILAAGCGHEIAVLGDQAWLGTGCGRLRLGRELSRRFDSARAAGIPVTTLALRNVEQVRDLDLLLDHGVTAIRRPAAESLPAQKSAATPIRFGIWQPPAARQLPPPPSWWSPTGWLLRREIKRTIRRRSLLHYEIDASHLAAHESGFDLVRDTVRFAAARRAAGQLAIHTIGYLAAAALAERTAIPTRSILRPAA